MAKKQCTGIIVQARTDSMRFPNKVLAKIQGKTMIWHVFNRIKNVKVEKKILATTNREIDKKLVKFAQENKIKYFSGSTRDVLDRYYQCAKRNNLDIIIRITSDCPLIDPKLISKMIKLFQTKKYDYISNTINPTFPDGLDVEIFSFVALEKSWKKAKIRSEREHVTPYIIKNSKKFKVFNYQNEKNLSYFRWTVDHKEDLQLIRKIYKKFYPKNDFSTKSILRLLKQNPALIKINKKFYRNEGYKNSLQKDRKITI